MILIYRPTGGTPLTPTPISGWIPSDNVPTSQEHLCHPSQQLAANTSRSAEPNAVRPLSAGKGGGGKRRPGTKPGRRSSTVPQQQISSDKEKEHHRNHAVHSEERRAQLTQIIVANKHVFVQQKRGHGDHSHHRQLTKSKHNNQRNQQPEHHDVKQTGNDERISD